MEAIAGIGTWIYTNGGPILVAATAVVAAASAIANLTPTDVDNKLVASLGKVVNWLALNFVKK